MAKFKLNVQDCLKLNESVKSLKLKELEIEEIKKVLNIKSALRAINKTYHEFLNDTREVLVTADVEVALRKQQAKEELTDDEKNSIEQANRKFNDLNNEELSKEVVIEAEPLNEIVIVKMIKYSELSVEDAELLYQLIE